MKKGISFFKPIGFLFCFIILFLTVVVGKDICYAEQIDVKFGFKTTLIDRPDIVYNEEAYIQIENQTVNEPKRVLYGGSTLGSISLTVGHTYHLTQIGLPENYAFLQLADWPRLREYKFKLIVNRNGVTVQSLAAPGNIKKMSSLVFELR
ncbi:MAG: hypothetical protein GX684_00565 [Ruminococcaceae bacterium]|nr:hypothetical protein [Oscillospiraceae bacterium]